MRSFKTAVLAWLLLALPVAGHWEVLPASRPTLDNSYVGLSNGWSVAASQYGQICPRRVHIVFTRAYREGEDTRLDVYHRYTDWWGRSWYPATATAVSDATDEYDSYWPNVACLRDTVAVAWRDDDPTDHYPIQVRRNRDGGHPERWLSIASSTEDDEGDYHLWPSLAMWMWSDEVNKMVNYSRVLGTDYANWRAFCVGWIQDWEQRFNDHYDGMSGRGSVSGECGRREPYFAWEQWNGDDYDIYLGNGRYTLSDDRLSFNDADDVNPSVQTLTTQQQAFWVGVAFQSETRVHYYLCNAQRERVAAAFPFGDSPAVLPNIWYDEAAAEMYAVCVGDVAGGNSQIYFTSSADQTGQTWRQPLLVSYSDLPGAFTRASVSGHGRRAQVFAQYECSGQLPQNFGVFFPLTWWHRRLVAPDVTACNAAQRLVRGPGASPELFRVVVRPDDVKYLHVERSSDGGGEWSAWVSPAFGEKAAIAVTADTALWSAYVLDDTVFCTLVLPSDFPRHISVYAGSGALHPEAPSLAVYPTTSNGVYPAAVTFCVYDTSAGTSQVLWAKVDTGSVILDTIASRNDLLDSFPCINVFQTDTLVVTWQDAGAVKQSLLCDYPAASGSRPPAWSWPFPVTMSGRHPMSAIEGTNSVIVWADSTEVEEQDVFAIRKRACNLASTVGAWGPTVTVSSENGTHRDNAVYAGAGVSCWEEEVSGKWAILGQVRGDTMVFYSSDTNARHPHEQGCGKPPL
ncbi:hypothetical protein FJY71_04270 [candidate division WOR-3 bacterium]|nr:hypothetical protein [candidate division WOR-3 bacterium]